MELRRVISREVFSWGAFLLVVFSVCGMGLWGNGVYQVVSGQEPLMRMASLVVTPLLCVTVFVSSCYILMGRFRWLFNAAAGLLFVVSLGAIGLIVAALAGWSTPWDGDELNMGKTVAKYCLFLLMGVWLKRRGYWDKGAGSESGVDADGGGRSGGGFFAGRGRRPELY